MRKIFLSLTIAAGAAGCAVQPVETVAVEPAPPVVAVTPVGYIVCNDTGDPVIGCYSAQFGYYTVNGWDYVRPPPVGFVPVVGVSFGVGFGGGGTVVNNTVVNNTVVNNTVVNHAAAAPAAVAHPSFAQAHPGFIAGLRNVGHTAAVAARATGKVAVAASKAKTGATK